MGGGIMNTNICTRSLFFAPKLWEPQYAFSAQRHRLYLVFVLPLAGVGLAAHLVQILGLSLADSACST